MSVRTAFFSRNPSQSFTLAFAFVPVVLVVEKLKPEATRSSLCFPSRNPATSRSAQPRHRIGRSQNGETQSAGAERHPRKSDRACYRHLALQAGPVHARQSNHCRRNVTNSLLCWAVVPARRLPISCSGFNRLARVSRLDSFSRHHRTAYPFNGCAKGLSEATKF